MIPFSNEEARRFSSLQWPVGAAILSVGLLFGFVSYEVLLRANHALLFQQPSSRFTLLPDHWLWMFLPLFGGISLAWELTLRLWMVLGDPLQAKKYESWSNTKAGFDATRLLRIFTIVVTVPIAIGSLMALPIHTAVTDTGLSVGHFGTLGVTNHPFKDVREITVTDGLRTRDGSLKPRPAIVLMFSDGTRWSSADNRDPEKAINESLLRLIQEKTGLPVRHIDAFPFGMM